MESAQETYRRFLRDYVSPRVRALGMKGSGGHYLLPDDKDWIAIGFQGSRWSDASRVLFTLNMCVISKADWARTRADPMWARSLPAVPNPNNAGPVGVSWRIGAVLEPGETWWLVRAAQSLDELADEIVEIVRDGALPWLRHNRDDPEYYLRLTEAERPTLAVKLGRFPTDFDF